MTKTDDPRMTAALDQRLAHIADALDILTDAERAAVLLALSDVVAPGHAARIRDLPDAVLNYVQALAQLGFGHLLQSLASRIDDDE